MGNTTLDLLIQARADFGAAKSQLTGLHQFLQGLEQQSKGVGGLIDLKPETIKNIEALNKALAKTGQAGKALSAIQFPEAKFRAAAVQVEAMRRNFEQLQKTDLGKLARDLAKAAGQDVTNPLSWQWDKMTRGMQMQDAMILRNAYHGALYQPGSGPHGGGPGGPGSPGGGRDWGAYGARFGSWMGSGIGGGLLRTGGAIGSLALGGGIMGAMFAGYRENQQTLEGVDAIFKSIGGNVGGFQALKDQVTELGSALQITGSAASELASSFVRTSGANDMQALERAQAAGQFGRGLGMDPGASTQLFGRAGLIGVGNTRQTQRDFASLMGKTIADSGMFARSEQVMEGMVGQLERIASTQGRTASAAEMQSISAILGDMLKNPALRGGGVESVMGVAQRLGNGSDLAMAMMAYEGITGGDLGKTIEIANADAMTPIGQLRGFEGTGITDTRGDYMVRNVRRMSQGTGLDEGQFAAMQFGVNPELYRQYAQTFDGKRLAADDSGFRSWMGQMGLDPNQVNMGGMGTLADIYKNQGAAPGSAHINRLVSLAEEYRTNGQLKDQPELLQALNEAGDPQQLQAVMAKIVGTVGAPKTEADIARQAQADLTTALGKVGEAINLLIPPIKEGLTPAVKLAAEYLRDILDFFGVGDDDNPYAGDSGRSRESEDRDYLRNWRKQGLLDADMKPNPDKPMTDDVKEFYLDVLRRRQAAGLPIPSGVLPGSTPPPATEPTSPADSTSAARPAYSRWNVAPPQASNQGVTSTAAGSASAGTSAPAVTGSAPHGSPISWRNNNPGNLRGQYFGATGSAGGFATYATPQAGWDAMEKQLTRYYEGKTTGHPLQTISDIIDTYAPSSENDSGAYKNVIARKLGIGVNDTLDWSNPETRRNLMSAMATHEAGRNTPYGSTLGREVVAEPAGAPAAPVAAEPVVAPAAPVATEPAISPATPGAPEAPQHAGDLAVLAPRTDLDGPRQQNVPNVTLNSDPSTLPPDQRAQLEANIRAAEARDAAGAPAYDGIRDFGRREGLGAMPDPLAAPPPTPDPVVSMTNPTAANARVDGQVSVNINVAKDGKPVSESFRALSFAEPRVPGSGGTQPKNNRVEWSNTV